MMELTRVPWSQHAEENLLVAAGNETELAVIRGDVESGIAVLFRHPIDGYLVVRVDECTEYKELVIVAGQGRNFKKYIPIFESMARLAGASKIRTHVARKGLLRMYEREGYKIAQHVLVKEVDQNV